MRFLKKKQIINPDVKIDFFSVIFSSFFFVGYLPFASGTFGSIAAFTLFLIPGALNISLLSIIIIIVFISGVYTSQKMTLKYGDDPSVVVIDEVIGMWFAFLIFLFFFNSGLLIQPVPLIILFLTFRFFDIFKIFPSSYFDKINTGYGIMMDDVFAGIYSGFSTVIIIYILKSFQIILF